MAFHPCTVHYSDHPPPSALRAARRANVSVLRSSEDNRPCGPFIHRVHRSARPYIAFANRRQRLCVYLKKTNCRKATKQGHRHQRRSALPAVRETFGPPNAALLLPRPDGPNEIASSRRPVAWPPSALALPCSLRGVTLSDRRPWLGSDPWKVDVCREDGITRPAALRSFPRTVWTPFFGIWLNLELSL